MDTYFAYLRKSTDSEDRQIQSLESQQEEIEEKIIKTRNIKIKQWFFESKSAKAPGRPLFNEMLNRLNKGEANNIVTWDIDRLARNPKDAGELIWIIQSKGIRIITPNGTYDGSSNYETAFKFTNATEFVIKLSRDVKRGLYTKVKMGMAPGLAPIGYIPIFNQFATSVS